MFSVSLLLQALLTTAAFAIPSNKERLSERVARRDARRDVNHQSKPVNLINSQAKTDVKLSSNDVLSSNWAGAVLVADTATYESVTGTFTIPAIRTDNDNVLECVAAWVGIDGDTCGAAILQTGIDLCVASDEVTLSFTAWHEFFPAPAVDFDGISFSVGDSVTLTATVTSPTSGTLVITNNNNGLTVSQDVTSTSASLCQTNAEWIVEDYGSNEFDEIPNFQTVLFTSASATTLDGVQVTPGGGDATIFDIELFSPDFFEDEIMTNTSVDGDTVTITYQEPLGGF